MSMASRVDHLKHRHRQLEDTIVQQQRHPSTDRLDIAALKREKLKLKDEIERLSKTLH